MKKYLAVLGGKAAFKKPLHVGRPNVMNLARFQERVNQMFERCWLSNNGPLVQEFEKRIAEFVGVKHCICVCNATTGLEIAIRAADLKGEVIVPSFTFIATAHALKWQGLVPIFADIDPNTQNLDPTVVEQHITKRTTAILATHVWGRPCAIEPLTAIARQHNLKLIFDAAHSFGCSHNGRMIGGFGSAEVFSFHATKFLNSFEGGAITTNDDAMAARIRLMTNFGFSGYDNVVHLGINGKMTEVCAAMGLSNLEGVGDIIALNARNYEDYRKALKQTPGIDLISYDEQEKCNFQYIVTLVDSRVAPLNRDDLISVLHAENVLARKYFWPGCHNMEPYKTLYPNAGARLRETRRIAEQVLVLPTGSSVSRKDIQRIVLIIKTAFASASQIRRSLGAANA